MATGDYVTVDEYKASRSVRDSLDDVEIARAITVASRSIDNYCGRQFYQDASTSVRTYDPTGSDTLYVDDISTTTGLVVVDNNQTLVVGTDFDLYPTGGFTNAGEAGPFYILKKRYGVCWYDFASGPSVSVTARWGWAITPPAIKDSCLSLVSDILQGRDNTFGVIGLDAGAAMRVRMNSLVQATLDPYRRGDTSPAFGFA